MRRLLPAFLFLAPLLAEPLSQQDKDQLIQHLERTRKIFHDAIAGVNSQQWTFKASPERWSIAECAEHLAVTEDLLRDLATVKMMQSPAPSEPPAKRVSDAEVLKFVTDRSQKGKAPEVLQPKSRYPSKAEVSAAFDKTRDVSINYVKTTQDDLRSRFNPGPRGATDAYQYLLLMAGHTERHSMQIEEVKASPGYPK